MCKNHQNKSAAVTILICLFLLSGNLAAESKPDENSFLKVRFLLQPWIQLSEQGAPNSKSWGKDAFLRRTRILLSGRISDRINFFMETDSPNWGKNGVWSGDMFIQDAFLDFTLITEQNMINSLNLAVGMILLPFSHHNRQSAASLNTLDYHSSLIKFPSQSHKVWRDSGLEVRGMFFDRHLDIRVGVFNGKYGGENRGVLMNPDDSLRFAGRMQYNFLDPESGFFYGGNYLGTKKILSIGLGFDHQSDIVFAGEFSAKPVLDYYAAVVDFFLDFPLTQDTELVLQAGCYLYDYGDDIDYSGSNAPQTGKAYMLESGIRYKWIEPVFSYEKFVPKYDSGAGYFLEHLRFGLNFWLQGHTLNLKLEYAQEKTRDLIFNLTQQGKLTFQTQLLF